MAAITYVGGTTTTGGDSWSAFAWGIREEAPSQYQGALCPGDEDGVWVIKSGEPAPQQDEEVFDDPEPLPPWPPMPSHPSVRRPQRWREYARRRSGSGTLLCRM